MQFVIDAQLPPALARWLVSMGHKAEHVADVGLTTASDQQIWDYAVSTHAIIITKDEDFAARRALSVTGPQILWLRVGNTRRQTLISWFDTVLTRAEASLSSGWSIVEMRDE